MLHQLKSFSYAFKGIGYTITHEGHFRFHMVAAAYVIYFGIRFYHFTAAQWGVLAVLIALVLSVEVINTSIERLCNKVQTSYDDIIRIAKDVAAGAVLIAAIAAVAVAVVFFLDFEIISSIFNFYITHIVNLIALIASIILSVLFIALCKSKEK